MQEKETLPPLFFHILPLSALHSRTPGLMYAFGLTYTLPLLPSFLQKMMMNCWMQHRTSTCLSPPQLAALSRIWNKLLMTCTLPPLNRYLLISRPFQSAPHILPAHASKSTATGFHRRVLACPFQLCRTTHRPRPRSHWICVNSLRSNDDHLIS